MATEATVQTMEQQIVVFALKGEFYGLDISRVQGIIKMPEVTWVPRAPEFVEGVINLRGVIVPIIDLRKRFGLGQFEEGADTRIINVEMGDHLVGLIVDAVEEVLTISREAVEPMPDVVTGENSSCLREIARLDGRLVVLVELDGVLTAAEQGDLQQIAAVS